MARRLRKSNDRINHENNIDRLIMERDNIFNNDTRTERHNPNQNFTHKKNTGRTFPDSKSRMGEITGEIFDSEDLDQGMPMRPFLSTEREKVSREVDFDKPYLSMYNPGLDFDLYDKKSDINVAYYDPYSSNISNDYQKDFSNLSDVREYDDESDFPIMINRFSLNIFQKFMGSFSLNKSFVISPYQILKLFSVLYIGSNNSTEKELNDVIFGKNKDSVFESFYKLDRDIIGNNIKGINMILLPTGLINDAFIDYIKDFAVINTINLKRPTYEFQRINNFCNKVLRVNTNVLEQNILNNNTCITLLSILNITCNWKYAFNYVTNRPFDRRRIVPMMIQSNSTHRHYSDKSISLLEMDLSNDDLCMGFILSNTLKDLSAIELEELNYCIDNLTNVKFNTVMIPKFRQQSKFKIDNLFKKMGLRNLFLNADLSEITPATNVLYVSDIIHQTIITINETGLIQNNRNIITQGSADFIADCPFIYYIRFKPGNVLISLGKYA